MTEYFDLLGQFTLDRIETFPLSFSELHITDSHQSLVVKSSNAPQRHCIKGTIRASTNSAFILEARSRAASLARLSNELPPVKTT